MTLDFQGQKLRKSKEFWKNKDLRGANFSAADLSASDFRGLNLAGACFDGALLYSTRFDEANLTGASFRRVRTGRTWIRCVFIETFLFLTSGLLAFVGVSLLGVLLDQMLTNSASNERVAHGVAFCVDIGIMSFFAICGLRAGAIAGAVAVAVAFAGSVAGLDADAFAGAVTVAFTAAGAGAFTLTAVFVFAFAVAGAVAGVTGAVVLAAAFAFAGAGTGAFNATGAGAAAGALLLFVIFTFIAAHRTFRKHRGFESFYDFRVRISSIVGTSFRGAVVDRAVFAGATLRAGVAQQGHVTFLSAVYRR